MKSATFLVAALLVFGLIGCSAKVETSMSGGQSGPETASKTGEDAGGAVSVSDMVLTSDKDGSEPMAEFKPDTPEIYLKFSFEAPSGSALKAVWYAEEAEGVKEKNIKLDEVEVKNEKSKDVASFSLSKPTKGWPVGTYRVELMVNDIPMHTEKFSVVK